MEKNGSTSCRGIRGRRQSQSSSGGSTHKCQPKNVVQCEEEGTVLDWVASLSWDIQNMDVIAELMAHPNINTNTHGDEYNTTPFGAAVLNGKHELVKLLIVRENVEKSADRLWRFHTTILYVAETGR
ncbi:uncharacterized protein BDV17DRAFT_267967 [Aspergillus undulatus]|uniref:uncharacterized protein n=1 Tax=Aspergillus undulatus TaxID=1810928 RepID=UPI003CCDE071